MPTISLIQPSSVIFVSGGARGITAQCVIRLAETYHCQFILAGRSRLDRPEPGWAAGITDPAELKKAILANYQSRGEKPTPAQVGRVFSALLSSREIETTLQKIQAAGGKAEYISVDITNPTALKAAVVEPVERLGPVTGVIHGAGSLADKRIEKKSAIDYDMVYAPKVAGLRAILDCFPPAQLDFLVLFSSVVALWGNAGQADYALANTILDRAARALQSENPHCRVFSINWGPWEGGMVTPELKRFFAEKGIQLIPLDEGAQTLVDVLAHPAGRPVQVVVGGSPLAAPSSLAGAPAQVSLRRRLALSDNPFLHDHVIGEKPVLPATCAAAWLTHASLGRYPGYSLEWMEDFRVLKGLVFDDSLAPEHLLEITQTAAGEGRVKLETRVSSLTASGKPLFHYSARLGLVESARHKSRPLEQLPLPGQTGEFLSGSAMYQNGVLFHGPAFQGVVETTVPDETGLVMRVKLSQLSAHTQGQFPALFINPFVNDAIVQGLLVWSQRIYDAPCLPSHLERLEQYSPIRFDELYIVSLDIREHSPTSVVGNLLVQDQAGQVLARITGLQGTVSPLLRRLINVKAA